MDVEWIYLIIAGVLEPCWVIGLSKCEKFRNIPWTVATVVLLAGSMILLSLSLDAIPIGVAYAIWTGIGAIGTLAAGMILYKETITWLRMLFIVLIIAGIVGIRLSGGV